MSDAGTGPCGRVGGGIKYTKYIKYTFKYIKYIVRSSVFRSGWAGEVGMEGQPGSQVSVQRVCAGLQAAVPSPPHPPCTGQSRVLVLVSVLCQKRAELC